MAQDPWAAFQDVAVVDNPPRGAMPDAGGGRPLTVRGSAPAPAAAASSAADPWAQFQDVPVHDAPGVQGGGWFDTAKDMAASAAVGVGKGVVGQGQPLDSEALAGVLFQSIAALLLAFPDDIDTASFRLLMTKVGVGQPVQAAIHPDLAEVLAGSNKTTPTFLVTAYGKPFSVAGFGNWFRERCDEAGLPHCSAHGLRKATAARLAERGATAKEIMAVTGHQSLEEVEVYTRRADNAKLADEAMRKLTHRKPVSHLSTTGEDGETDSDKS